MLRRHWVEIAWGVFAAVNIALIVQVSHWETIPFHLLWVSLTIVYGFRIWRLGSTFLVLGIVMGLTALTLAATIARGHQHPDEIAEVPLMAAMFLAMVWHARRRQAAVEHARRLAETEHRLVEAQRGFISDASHELRTPITIARGHAELMRGGRLDSQSREDVEVVLDELDRLSRLSERLLLLAAAEQPDFLDPAPVEVDPLIMGVGRRWRGVANRCWTVECPGGGRVRLDRERFEIALDAVIENAVKATEEGEAIRIGARWGDSQLMVEIEDKGTGIPIDQVDRIFDRFARADADRTRDAGGTGLGLPIARAIARAHGGDLTVRCSRDGTMFLFIVPGSEPSPNAADEVRSFTVIG